MPSPQTLVRVSQDDLRLSAFAALGVLVHLLESGIPSPLPGLKPGLSNVVTFWVFHHWGWQAAAWVSGLRVMVTSFLFGTFLTPGFYFAISGAAGALCVLALCGVLWQKGLLSPVGLSVLLACGHTLAQFFCAVYGFFSPAVLLPLLPLLLLGALLFGVLSGEIARRLINLVPLGPDPLQIK
jgi:heptaprenyl diphosphate synthase